MIPLSYSGAPENCRSQSRGFSWTTNDPKPDDLVGGVALKVRVRRYRVSGLIGVPE